MTIQAKLHDGSSIDITIEGSGPKILLPINPTPTEGPKAEEMRKWGVDPALGRSLIDDLKKDFHVIAFDYENHLRNNPKPDTLTSENISRDFLAIADAVGAQKFAYYGYSWFAVSGMQLALRTDRLTALIMGGYPPINGPYHEMLAVTKATHALAVASQNNPKQAQQKQQKETEALDWDNAEMTLTESQTRQFVTLYTALEDFNDEEIQNKITCPRLCFVGSEDEIVYSEKWGGVTVQIAKPLIEKKKQLESLGWEVHILEGMDHIQAMQAKNVLPIIRPWLLTKIRG